MAIASSLDAPALRSPLPSPFSPAPSPFAPVSTRARLDRRGPDVTSTSSSSVMSMGVSASAPRRVPAIWAGGAEEPFTGRWIVPGRDADARCAGCDGADGVSFFGCAYLRSAPLTGDGAYSFTQSLAVASCFFLFDLYSCAITGTRGSEGLGSVRSDDRERMTL